MTYKMSSVIRTGCPQCPFSFRSGSDHGKITVTTFTVGHLHVVSCSDAEQEQWKDLYWTTEVTRDGANGMGTAVQQSAWNDEFYSK